MDGVTLMKPAKRLSLLTSAIFTEMNARKRQVEQQGIKVIDLGIGSPDLPPSPIVIEALTQAVQDPKNYRYPTSEGSVAFRQAVAEWYFHRFGITLKLDDEILALMGSQDGLAHLAQAWVDPGDIVLVPDPGYPIYSASVLIAGGEMVTMPLTEENGFLPKFDKIPLDVCKRAKLMILNYPNNPLTAIADKSFFEKVVEFAHKHNIIVVHDLAYSELAFDGFRPSSFLEVPGAKEIGIEFNSLSKTFNMAGCRIAYVVGNAEIIKPLSVFKSNIDYGVFLAVQKAAIAALKSDIENKFQNPNASVYEKRRDLWISGLREIGWELDAPKATMFVWAKIPQGWSSQSFAFTMLEKAGVVVIPGDAFGSQGEGYVRIALVEDEAVLKEAIRRIDESGILK
jgi:LL-diaminopimelate aminotransferase